jgi:hypothetical protein
VRLRDHEMRTARGFRNTSEVDTDDAGGLQARDGVSGVCVHGVNAMDFSSED